MRNKGTEQIPMYYIIILAMFAIGAGSIFIIMVKWLDLTGFKYELITQRNAMDLSQLIVSNSPLVKQDSSGEPIKLVLDVNKLNDYETHAGIGIEHITPDSEREKWEKCCDFLDFDYRFTVHKFKKENGDVVPDQTWTMSNLIFDRTSNCYIPRIMGVGDVPIVIYENGERHPGVAIVEMTKTPLSDLSFWLSQGFVRAGWNEYWAVFSSEESYGVTIPLDPEIECVKILDPDPGDNYQRVCVFLRKRCVGEYECKRYTSPGECTSHENCDWINSIEKACKNFVFMSIDDEGRPITFDEDNNKMMSEECFNVDIIVKRNEVKISYPGKDRNGEEC